MTSNDDDPPSIYPAEGDAAAHGSGYWQSQCDSHLHTRPMSEYARPGDSTPAHDIFDAEYEEVDYAGYARLIFTPPSEVTPWIPDRPTEEAPVSAAQKDVTTERLLEMLGALSAEMAQSTGREVMFSDVWGIVSDRRNGPLYVWLAKLFTHKTRHNPVSRLAFALNGVGYDPTSSIAWVGSMLTCIALMSAYVHSVSLPSWKHARSSVIDEEIGFRYWVSKSKREESGSGR